MAIKIEVNGITASDDAKILTNAKMGRQSDLDIKIENTQVCGNAQILTDLEIKELYQNAEAALKEMQYSSAEYASLKQLLKEGKKADRKEFLKKVEAHVKIFTDGVLQNIIANIVSGHIT